jgi:hypothetical protein
MRRSLTCCWLFAATLPYLAIYGKQLPYRLRLLELTNRTYLREAVDAGGRDNVGYVPYLMVDGTVSLYLPPGQHACAAKE